MSLEPTGGVVTGGGVAVLPAELGQARPQTIVVAAAQQPAPQQVPQQAPLSTASGETLVLILCIAIVVTAWRKSKSVRWPLAAAIVAGTLLAGSIIGPMIRQTSGQAGTQMENMVTGFQNGVTGTGGTTGGTGTSP